MPAACPNTLLDSPAVNEVWCGRVQVWEAGPLPTLMEYEVLAVLEFNSTRKRQSSVVRHTDGSIVLYCKVWCAALQLQTACQDVASANLMSAIWCTTAASDMLVSILSITLSRVRMWSSTSGCLQLGGTTATPRWRTWRRTATRGCALCASPTGAPTEAAPDTVHGICT